MILPHHSPPKQLCQRIRIHLVTRQRIRTPLRPQHLTSRWLILLYLSHLTEIRSVRHKIQILRAAHLQYLCLALWHVSRQILNIRVRTVIRADKALFWQLAHFWNEVRCLVAFEIHFVLPFAHWLHVFALGLGILE